VSVKQFTIKIDFVKNMRPKVHHRQSKYAHQMAGESQSKGGDVIINKNQAVDDQDVHFQIHHRTTRRPSQERKKKKEITFHPIPLEFILVLIN